MIRLLCLAIGYLFGLFQTSYILGRVHGIDIREYGSHNAGTTNMLRTMGLKAGLLTFAGDCSKCILAVVLVRVIFGKTHADILPLLEFYAAAGTILGHNYPFYLGFKGGKGIAVTAAVVMSAANPIMIPIGLAIFVAAVAVTRYVSVGSLLVAWYIPFNTVIFHYHDEKFFHMVFISLLFTMFAYYQHRQNIVRLINGNENKLWKSKSEKEAGANE